MNKRFRYVLMNQAGEGGSAGGGNAALDLAGAPAPAPAPAPVPAPAPAPGPAPAPAANPWDGLDEDGKKFVESKGFKSPADALAALREHAAPETADGYQLPVPDGADPAFAKTVSTWFHEAGLSAKQASLVAGKWNEHATAIQQQMAQEDQQRATDAEAKAKRESETLTREWGETNDAQRELARRAFSTYLPGADQPAKDALAKTLQERVGYAATMKMFAAIGAHLAESPAHGLGGAGGAPPPPASFYENSKMNR